MDLGRQSDVSAFEYAVSVGHSFPSKEQAFSNFVAAVPSAVILEPKTIKSLTVSIVPPSICPEVMGLDAVAICHSSFTSVLFTMAIYQPEI